MKFRNIIFSLPIIAFSLAANAEIQLDADNNVSYTGLKNSKLEIKADGSASVNGTLIKKCEGDENGKVSKSKLGSVTCDDGFVILKDRIGNVLSRFTSYALATDNRGTNERKLFDPSMAKLGSASSGASVLSQTQETTVEQTKITTTEKLAPGANYLNRPKIEAPKINEATYTPKLGVMAQKTPSITKENTPDDNKADRAVAKAEKEARRAPAGSTVPMPSSAVTAPVVVDTQISPKTVETRTTTTVSQPTPSAAAAGVEPSTSVKMDTVIIGPDAEETPGNPIPSPQ